MSPHRNLAKSQAQLHCLVGGCSEGELEPSSDLLQPSSESVVPSSLFEVCEVAELMRLLLSPAELPRELPLPPRLYELELMLSGASTCGLATSLCRAAHTNWSRAPISWGSGVVPHDNKRTRGRSQREIHNGPGSMGVWCESSCAAV